AGNDNINFSDDPYYPAGDSNVIAVAATDSEDYVTWYSNSGGIIDLAAPGGSFDFYIDHGVTCTAMGDTFSAMEGTSFSAPQVSALAALLWLQNPTRSGSDLRTLMVNHCENPRNEEATYIGAGRINILESLRVWKTPTITPTITPTPTVTKTYTITPTATITPTVTPTPTITVTFTITPTATITPTSTPLVLGREEVRIYPQPGREYVRVAFHFQGQGRVSLGLYTVVGERVIHLEEGLREQGGSAILEIATNKVSPGIYYLYLQVEDALGKRQLKGKVAIIK
ncbi:S8 family serine peptidase, partial [bacterium]|nr:S8 family serine peptidase [bacterium]